MTDLDLRGGQIHRGLGVVARWPDIALVVPSDSSHDAAVDQMFHDLGPEPEAAQIVAAVNELLAKGQLQAVAMVVEATGGPMAMAFGQVEVLVDGDVVLNGSNGGVRQQVPASATRLILRAAGLPKAAEPVAPYDLRRGVAPGAGLTLLRLGAVGPAKLEPEAPAPPAPPAPPGPDTDADEAAADRSIDDQDETELPIGAPPAEQPAAAQAPPPNFPPPGPPASDVDFDPPGPDETPSNDEPPVDAAPEVEVNAEVKTGGEVNTDGERASGDGAQAEAEASLDDMPTGEAANGQDPSGESASDDTSSSDDASSAGAPSDDAGSDDANGDSAPAGVRSGRFPDGDDAEPAAAERAAPAVEPSPLEVPFRSVVLVGSVQPGDVAPLPQAGQDSAPLGPGDIEAGRVEVQGIRCTRQHFNNPDAAHCMVCGLSLLHLTDNLVTGLRPTLGFIVFDDGSAYGLDRSYVIGREPNAPDGSSAQMLVLRDNNETLSRTHASLRLDDWAVHLLDLGSTNGTYVWDHTSERWNQLSPNTPLALGSGDTVALGRRTFVFESVSRN